MQARAQRSDEEPGGTPTYRDRVVTDGRGVLALAVVPPPRKSPPDLPGAWMALEMLIRALCARDNPDPKVQKQCGDQLWLNATLVARALGFEDLAVQAVDFAGEERAFLAVLRP